MDEKNKYNESFEELTVQELDENGFLSTVFQGTSTGDLKIQKIDRNANQSAGLTLSTIIGGSLTEILQSLINIFLPTGYPNSVSADYIDYQIYDSIQAFSSSIASLFANRAVLSAVGVGDDSATSTSALFMKIIQETVGRLGTILFAWKLGSTLEPECKKFRFMADLVNDSATIFDCLSPLFPGSKNTKLIMLCMSGLLRSICGVMAGGSRAALTQHFTDPLKGSIADVNAKDQSQETVITLMGMLTGSIVVGIIQGEGLDMWMTVVLLLSLHLWTNYQAVSSVVIRTLNRQRTNIVFSDIINSLPELEHSLNSDADSTRAMSKLILNPRRTSTKERILETDGVLRWYNFRSGTDMILGYAKFGGFKNILVQLPSTISLQQLLNANDANISGYILYYHILRHTGHVRIDICLVDGNSINKDKHSDLQAWVHALLIAKTLKSTNSSIVDPLTVITDARQTVVKLFHNMNIPQGLSYAGWNLDKSFIQSHPNPCLKLATSQSEPNSTNSIEWHKV